MQLLFDLSLIIAVFIGFLVVLSVIVFCLTCGVDPGRQEFDPSGCEQPNCDPEHSCCSDWY